MIGLNTTFQYSQGCSGESAVQMSQDSKWYGKFISIRILDKSKHISDVSMIGRA